MRHARSGRHGDAGLEGRLAGLIADAEDLGAGREHRREALLERAESRGLGRGEAEKAYDLAIEEGVEPAYALAVVGHGISVRSFGGSPPAEASEAVEPEWIDRPPSADDATLERRLRETLRRLRSFLASEPTPRDALTRFAREPDLETYEY
ncbi:MAG TPA: hypothetical protein VMM12_16785 [Longimicrobiales bacterium]|nr:hypothetical protein [Longimicrobiales bacterium]